MARPREITGVLVGDTLKKMTVKDELDTWYELIECRCIDIVSTTVDGIKVDIVCDDEACLIDKPVPHAVNSAHRPVLFGKLFVCGLADCEGNLTSLTNEQCEQVLQAVALCIHNETETRLVLETTYGD